MVWVHYWKLFKAICPDLARHNCCLSEIKQTSLWFWEYHVVFTTVTDFRTQIISYCIMKLRPFQFIFCLYCTLNVLIPIVFDFIFGDSLSLSLYSGRFWNCSLYVWARVRHAQFCRENVGGDWRSPQHYWFSFGKGKIERVLLYYQGELRHNTAFNYRKLY